MWEVLKAEVSYMRFGYLVFFATIPLLVMLGVVSEDGDRAYVVLFVIIMTINYWTAKRIKEKRDFHLAQLPISRKDVGRARALMIIMTTASYLVMYGIIRSGFARDGLTLRHALLIFGLIVAIYSAVLMFRDRYVGTKSLIPGKAVLVAALVAVAAAGLYAMIATDEAIETGSEPPMVVKAIDYAFKRNLLADPTFLACLVVGSLVLAYLSVVTFQHRKSNVE